jgi:hypothetical protein
VFPPAPTPLGCHRWQQGRQPLPFVVGELESPVHGQLLPHDLHPTQTHQRSKKHALATLVGDAAGRDQGYPVGAGAAASFCHRPNSFPSVSLQIANQPMLGTGLGSFASPPSSFTRAAPALMSST